MLLDFPKPFFWKLNRTEFFALCWAIGYYSQVQHTDELLKALGINAPAESDKLIDNVDCYHLINTLNSQAYPTKSVQRFRVYNEKNGFDVYPSTPGELIKRVGEIKKSGRTNLVKRIGERIRESYKSGSFSPYGVDGSNFIEKEFNIDGILKISESKKGSLVTN